jgi:hypothetical protein
MSGKRRSTVYDLASLRLHPDGTRVPSTDYGSQDSGRTLDGRKRGQKVKNRVTNINGDRIADDACGHMTVKARKRREDEGATEMVDVTSESGAKGWRHVIATHEHKNVNTSLPEPLSSEPTLQTQNARKRRKRDGVPEYPHMACKFCNRCAQLIVLTNFSGTWISQS